MKKYIFPAIFSEESVGISVFFPDLPGCLPCARDYEQAFQNSREALNLHLSCMIEDGEEIPTPSKIKTIVSKLGEGEALTLIETQI